MRQDELTHHGILGMHWGVRKAESLRKEAAKLKGKAANSRSNAAMSRLEAKGIRNRIATGAHPSSTVRDAEGNIVSRTSYGDNRKALNDAVDEARTNDEWAAKYEARAKLALKRASGKKLTAADLAMKRDIFHEGMTRAAVLGILAVPMGIGAMGITGSPIAGGLVADGMLIGAGVTAVKTRLNNREIKK